MGLFFGSKPGVSHLRREKLHERIHCRWIIMFFYSYSILFFFLLLYTWFCKFLVHVVILSHFLQNFWGLLFYFVLKVSKQIQRFCSVSRLPTLNVRRKPCSRTAAGGKTRMVRERLPQIPSESLNQKQTNKTTHN